MSPDAEVIICYCLKCGVKLGGFGNSWEGLGKTYYIPKFIKDVTGFKGVGAIKLSDGPLQVGTVIENRSLSKRPSIFSRAPRPSDIPRQSVEEPFTPAVSSPLMPDDSAMMATIHEQRKDIDRIDAALRRFQKDMQDVKLFLQNIRQEMNEVQNTRPVTDSVFESFQEDVLCASEKASGVDDLRTELYSLRARVKDMEKATRQALVSENRVLTTPELSDESQGRDMQNSIPIGTWNQPSDVKGALMAGRSGALNRKRRYSEAESDQMDDKAAKLAKFGEYKRRKELEGRQDGNTGSNSITPTRLATKGPATLSQPRTESPILGLYDKSGDADHTKQDDNVQHMEQDMERQIPESPSQQIDTELTTLDEHNNIEENQRLKRISQATGNQIPELSQNTSSRSSNIPFRTSGGDSFTSDLPQNHFQSLNQRIEVLNSSQSGLSQNTQEQQLPAQPRRGPGRPRSANKPIPPADSMPHAHRGPGRPRSTNKPIPLVDSTPHAHRGPGRPRSTNKPIPPADVTLHAHRPRGRPKGSLNKNHSDSNISFRSSNEELSTPGRELRRRTIPFPGSSPPVKEVANTSSNNLVIDLTEKGSGETGELREIGESPMAQSSQAQEDHSPSLQDVEMEDILQPINPTKRQRRNTRSSRHRPSVDLDEILNSRPANTNSDIAMASEENERAGNQAKRDGRYLSGFNGTPSDEDETYTENYDADKKGKQHQERKKEDEREEEGWRGREREREMDKESEERRRSTRTRELEKREELVKEMLGRDD
ncbi:predicted protein [Sclerotinia sclerotiorum 1980 UF-70]|uniref:Uncharacterized protein n=1 Tax=Sclerotinia sclerotiorum (strain ATCC 18683 / 1980 / Ss-1) TaxID=665079 RepID=A7ERC8_SCLS1|nr:predicted protein [Sclerotinia sclerotiorum 1980 UF-70]EDN92020.1 predicted protein [Sclerotinia sclerotiorum 1980 UF-70]